MEASEENHVDVELSEEEAVSKVVDDYQPKNADHSVLQQSRNWIGFTTILSCCIFELNFDQNFGRGWRCEQLRPTSCGSRDSRQVL